MSFSYARRYRGAVQAVIFDWAGTTVDFGSMAPVAVFLDVFERFGVPISLAEARGPMGAEKRHHIEMILSDDMVAARWREHHGSAHDDEAIDRLYATFNETLLEILPRHATVIPGVIETVAALRARGVKVGTDSGYSDGMMAVLAAAAAPLGFAPDCIVSASDVARGRPAPYMTFRCLERLGVEAVAAAVKVDDTISGVEEGLNAGVWTVGLAVTGNEVGLSLADWEALPPEEQAARRAAAARRLAQAGAHYVIDGVADLMPVIDDINARLSRGEAP